MGAANGALHLAVRMPARVVVVDQPLPSQAFYLGASTLKERIAKADAIARVELLSVAQIVEAITNSNRFVERYTVYVAALEYKFRVLEYLKGSGGGAMLVEIDPRQLRAVTSLAAYDFPAGSISHRRDLSGRPRVVIVTT